MQSSSNWPFKVTLWSGGGRSMQKTIDVHLGGTREPQERCTRGQKDVQTGQQGGTVTNTVTLHRQKQPLEQPQSYIIGCSCLWGVGMFSLCLCVFHAGAAVSSYTPNTCSINGNFNSNLYLNIRWYREWMNGYAIWLFLWKYSYSQYSHFIIFSLTGGYVG